MPDSNDIHAILRRLDAVERNHTMLASTQTHFTQELENLGELIDALRLDRAARVERDKRLDDRFADVHRALDRMEAQIKGVYRIGWWVLAAFGTSAVAFISNFALGGGFSNVP